MLATWLALGIVSVFGAVAVWHMFDLGVILGGMFVGELMQATYERWARVRQQACRAQRLFTGTE